MFYNAANTIDIGRPVKYAVDANGLRWYDLYEVDTDTGRLVVGKRDEYGNPLVDHEKGEFAREEIYTAAPVVLVFAEPGETR